jgi:Bifunctional DNA primase/polymerase, N-terminal/Primase C terminal 1 (PriCT-1)
VTCAVERWVESKSRDRRGRRRKEPTLDQLVRDPAGLAALAADGISLEKDYELTAPERATAEALKAASAGRPVKPRRQRQANPTLETVLRRAARGRPSFPCDSATKAPLTAHGFRDASRDEGQLRRWFDRSSPPMIGMPTGAVTNLVVLDVDKGGADSLHDLERAHGELPRTASVKTPSGGQHYYFRHPGVEVPCSAGKLGRGLDVRADGGFVVTPPSVRHDGRRYEVDEEAPAAPMPQWLLALVTRPASAPRQPSPSGGCAAMVRDGLTEGGRNDGLARLTGYLLRKYVDVDLTAEIVHLVNQRSTPPLDADEVDRTIDSIIAIELRRRQGSRR